jgi:hypothetical protein
MGPAAFAGVEAPSISASVNFCVPSFTKLVRKRFPSGACAPKCTGAIASLMGWVVTEGRSKEIGAVAGEEAGAVVSQAWGSAMVLGIVLSGASLSDVLRVISGAALTVVLVSTPIEPAAFSRVESISLGISVGFCASEDIKPFSKTCPSGALTCIGSRYSLN